MLHNVAFCDIILFEVIIISLKIASLNFRAENNLTQQEFADKLNIGREVVIRIEQGKEPRAITRRKMELYIGNNK